MTEKDDRTVFLEKRLEHLCKMKILGQGDKNLLSFETQRMIRASYALRPVIRSAYDNIQGAWNIQDESDVHYG